MRSADRQKGQGEPMGMTEKAKELRREYKRRWNRQNRDRVRASQERYWNRKAEAAEQETEEAARRT